MGRVLRRISGDILRYFNSNGGLCSVKFWSDCGLPASSSATFNPASARRLHAQPPEAPEPTTITSKGCFVFCAMKIASQRMLTSGGEGVNRAGRNEILQFL